MDKQLVITIDFIFLIQPLVHESKQQPVSQP